MTVLECENRRKSDNEILEQKIKINVLDLKLWIITSIVIFLFSTGGTFIYMAKKAGSTEEQIAGIIKTQGEFKNTIDVFRDELWNFTRPYRQPAATAQQPHSVINQPAAINNFPVTTTTAIATLPFLWSSTKIGQSGEL